MSHAVHFLVLIENVILKNRTTHKQPIPHQMTCHEDQKNLGIAIILIVTLFSNCTKDALESSLSPDQNRTGLDAYEMPKICTELLLEDHTRAFGHSTAFWNKNELRIRFMGGSDYVRSKVRQYAIEWSKYGHINFQFVESEPSDIRISFDSDVGSWSYVGRTNSYISPRRATMNFGWFNNRTREEEFRRTTLHEFGHALGLSHEHQHPEAAINWNREAVYQYYRRTQDWSRSDVDGNIFRKYSISSSNYSNYDPQSIMHYYIPRALVIGNWTPRSNTSLSSTDMAFIESVYPFGEGERPLVMDYCNCPDTLKVIACEDFEEQTQASLEVSEDWTKWSDAAGEAELQSYSWGRVLKILHNPNENPDILYQPGLLKSGIYVIRWDMYVGNGSTAYFNMQKLAKAGAEFGAQFFLDQDGGGRIEINNREVDFDYVQSRWNGMELALDFEHNVMTFSLQDEPVASWPLKWSARSPEGALQFGGLNFYAIDANAKFWLDNFCVSEISAITSARREGALLTSQGRRSGNPKD